MRTAPPYPQPENDIADNTVQTGHGDSDLVRYAFGETDVEQSGMASERRSRQDGVSGSDTRDANHSGGLEPTTRE